MKQKRKVSANLGRTQHSHAEKFYIQIKKRIGEFRRCPFYNGKKYPQFDVDEHDKLNSRFPNPNVPVEQFDSGKRMHADHWVPLRAGGINDISNFQPLCNACNIRKNDQIDPRLTSDEIRMLIGTRYQEIVLKKDSIETIERKLKASLVKYLKSLLTRGRYLDAIRQKKKEVNGQWNVERAYRKGVEWLKRNT